MMVADVAALTAIAVLSMVVRFGFDWPDAPPGLYLLSIGVAVAVFTSSLYFGGLYEREPRLGAPPALPRAGRQTLAAGGLVALLILGLTGVARELGFETDRALPIPITNLATLIVVGAIAVAVNRRLVHVLRTHREGPPKVLLVGEPHESDTAQEHLRHDRRRVEVVGTHRGREGLPDAVERVGATDVMLVEPSGLGSLYPEILRDLDARGVTVLLRVTALETTYGLERIREVGGMPFVLLRTQTMPRSRAQFKRAFDLAVLLATSPLLIVVLALVATYQFIVAGTPLLYWQERVGRGGRRFQMVKFRTMGVDAEADGRGARLAERDDPRVIPACRWIRATRLDELPQLWNVLRGEMSLVGPRPERPELAAHFVREIPGYERRHEIPPGLSGLAQIHGRYHTDPEYKLGYDLQYLVNWSPLLDLEILARTLWVVLARRI